MLKLCDFGLARRAAPGRACTPNVTSLWYRAPEILLGVKAYTSGVDMWSTGCIVAEWLQLGEPLMQGTGEKDQINTIFRLLGTQSDASWPGFSSLPSIATGLVQPIESGALQTMTLGPDGSVIKLPRSSLRKKLPAEGYTPAYPGNYRTTALAESGFELLSSLLCCDPARRRTAKDALASPWFTEDPLPVPLSRGEIRQLRRGRDEAINSGAHTAAIAQQRAATAAKVAGEHAAQVAHSIRERLQSSGLLGLPSRGAGF